MKNIILGLLIGAAVVIGLARIFPIQRTVITTEIKTKTITVLAEKERCTKAGGTFIISDFMGQRILCIAPSQPDIFNYNL